MPKPTLLRHLSGEPTGKFPVWMMRQAGRFLPEYRELRAKHSFWESVTSPALASEITLMPIRRFPLDAAILFSDILTLPYALEVPIELKESVGPVTTSPLRTLECFQRFSSYKPQTHTAYVMEALSNVRKALPSETALLGFAGAPWTVATYLVEGKPSKNFENIKAWAYQDPGGLSKALTLLGEATLEYLTAQSKAGADAVQVFDTWVSEVPKEFFGRYHCVLENLFSGLRDRKIPTIYYARNSQHLIQKFLGLSFDVLSVDAQLGLGEVDLLAGGRYALQGNLDPVLLLKADVGTVRKQTRLLVQEARNLKRPAILNLGHGVLPGTPIENVEAFIQEARQAWL